MSSMRRDRYAFHFKCASFSSFLLRQYVYELERFVSRVDDPHDEIKVVFLFFHPRFYLYT